MLDTDSRMYPCTFDNKIANEFSVQETQSEVDSSFVPTRSEFDGDGEVLCTSVS